MDKSLLEKITMIINTEDTSSDDDDTTALTTNLEHEKRNYEIDELEKIQDQVELAFETVTKINLCKYLLTDINHINEETLLSKYNDVILKDIKIIDEKAILIPYYSGHVAFSKIKWLKFNANNNLSNTLKNVQIQFLMTSNPAMWICEEFTNYDVEKKEWLEMINEIDFPKSTMFVSDVKSNRFILLEYNYLAQDNNLKGLCGVCMLLCELHDSKFKICDIANIKLSCNVSNNVYGNIIKFLEKYHTIPIFVYIPQVLQTSVLLNTYLFPWSYYFISQYERIFNLVNMIKIESKSLDDVLKKCIDHKIHYKSCAICNCLNLFFKLANNEFSTRTICESLNNTLINKNIIMETTMPRYITCAKEKYLTYNVNKTTILDVNCDCSVNS